MTLDQVISLAAENDQAAINVLDMIDSLNGDSWEERSAVATDEMLALWYNASKA